jgi:FkbM family methyltransferase
VAAPGDLKSRFLRELLSGAYEYAGGLDQAHPTAVDALDGSLRRRAAVRRDALRDRVERLAARAGFTRRHFDAAAGAQGLASVIDGLDGLETTYAALADERSRALLVDLLRLRVLGPYHVTPTISPEEFRARQAEVERKWRTGATPIEASDPFFPVLHQYAVPNPGGEPIRLYTHSAALVNIFVLEQYRYAQGGVEIGADSDEVVLDAGGCWGDSALYFARRTGPGGRVYTFEFEPESLDIMRRNLELNPSLAERIVVVEEALWHSSGETIEFEPAGQSTSVGGGSLSTTTTTIDDFVEARGLDRLDLVKMDVEGAEPSLLDGARRTLGRHGPDLAIAAYHRDSDLVDLPLRVTEADRAYRLYLDHFSASRDETVLFARSDRRKA